MLILNVFLGIYSAITKCVIFEIKGGQGDTLLHNTNNSFFMTDGKLVATVGIRIWLLSQPRMRSWSRIKITSKMQKSSLSN